MDPVETIDDKNSRPVDPEVKAWIESWDNLDDYDDSEHAIYDPKNGKQLITFSLGGDTYCINILNTNEIVDDVPVRSIPNTSSYIRGVINLRGAIIPIMDMRIRFHIPQEEGGETSVIIILRIYGQKVGIVVDSVSDVIYVPNHEIAPLVENLSIIDAEFIEGVININEEILMILDLETLFNQKQISAIYRGINKGQQSR